MAQQATVHYVDDVEFKAGRRVEAAHKGVRFGLDGAHYEIDLADPNYQKLAEILLPLVRAGRRSNGARTRPRPLTQDQKDRNDEIRTWAREQGMKCGPTGRIPANVLEAWQNRHTSSNGTSSNGKAAAAHRAVGTNPIWMPPQPAAAPAPAPTPPAPKQGPVFPDKKAMNAAIRAWCAEQGYPVKPRGAIPADMLKTYVEANGEPRLES